MPDLILASSITIEVTGPTPVTWDQAEPSPVTVGVGSHLLIPGPPGPPGPTGPHEHTAADVDSGASSDGQVLTSDGAGGASWEPLPGGNLQGVGVSTVWAGSQAAYDAISTPDPNTLYFVTG